MLEKISGIPGFLKVAKTVTKQLKRWPFVENERLYIKK
jgi:hypothetical protein